jgi:hypothetical protein
MYKITNSGFELERKSWLAIFFVNFEILAPRNYKIIFRPIPENLLYKLHTKDSILLTI